MLSLELPGISSAARGGPSRDKTGKRKGTNPLRRCFSPWMQSWWFFPLSVTWANRFPLLLKAVCFLPHATKKTCCVCLVFSLPANGRWESLHSVRLAGWFGTALTCPGPQLSSLWDETVGQVFPREPLHFFPQRPYFICLILEFWQHRHQYEEPGLDINWKLDFFCYFCFVCFGIFVYF